MPTISFPLPPAPRSLGIVLIGLLLAPVVHAEEEEPPLPEASTAPYSELRLGLGYLDDENTRYGEYRGLEAGGLFPALEADLRLRPAHDAELMRHGRLQARTWGPEAGTLQAEYGVQGDYRLQLDYQVLPWHEWPGIRTPFIGAGSRQLYLPDAGGKNQLSEHLRRQDLQRERESLLLGGEKLFKQRWHLSLEAEREETHGTRLRGFGRHWSQRQSFLAPEPLRSHTDTLEARLEYRGEALQSSAAWYLSAFSQHDNALLAEDPHAADWSSAPRRSASRAPDNLFQQLSLAAAYRLAPASRVSADLHLGRATQDDAFAEDAALVGRSNLDGKANTRTFNLRGTHRFSRKLRSRLSWRHEDRDNDTDTLMVDGHRSSPVDLQRDVFNATADYRLFRRSDLELGYEHRETRRDRVHGHRRQTEEDRYRLKLRARPAVRLTGGLRAELARQSGTVYDRQADDPSPDALRNHDQANRHSRTLGLFATVTPVTTLSLSGRVDRHDDDYDDSALGRTGAERDLYRLDLTWTPRERFNLHGFWSYEDILFELAGPGWAADQDDRVLTLGGGLESGPWGEHWNLGADLVRVQTASRVGPGAQTGFPDVHTRLDQLELFADYRVDRHLSLEARYRLESYRAEDWNLDRDPRDFDQVLTVGRRNPDYRAHLLMLSGTWRF